MQNQLHEQNSFGESYFGNVTNKIFDWDEFHLYNIADPILFCKNKYLNDRFLYIKIFCKLKNIEYLEYLVQNEIPYIKPPYYTKEQIKEWPLSLIENLKQNILIAMKVKDASGNVGIESVFDFLDEAIAS